MRRFLLHQLFTETLLRLQKPVFFINVGQVKAVDLKILCTLPAGNSTWSVSMCILWPWYWLRTVFTYLDIWQLAPNNIKNGILIIVTSIWISISKENIQFTKKNALCYHAKNCNDYATSTVNTGAKTKRLR